MEGGSLVQDHPLMYSKFEVSLGYRRPCLKNRPKKKKILLTAHGLKSPWNQINCPNSMASAICGALPVAELRSPPQPQVIKSLSLCGVRTVASGCPRGSERGLGFVSVSIQWKPFRYTTSHLRGTGQHSGYLPGRANADAPKRLLLFKLKIFIGGLQPPALLQAQPHEAGPAVPGSATSVKHVNPLCLWIQVLLSVLFIF